jgi:hypothetical protein
MTMARFRPAVVNAGFSRRGELIQVWLIPALRNYFMPDLRQKVLFGRENAKKRGAKKSVKYISAAALNHGPCFAAAAA